jgi:4-amino-4-deoxy-L-arabinose transferase-like glycosyltransferase
MQSVVLSPRRMKNYLLLAAIVLAGIIPFASRAVYMDEHIFLHVARSVQTHWLFPQDTPFVFFGTRLPNLAAHTHPPAGEYFLALLYLVFGEFREIPFRLAFSIFPVAAVLSFYNLARRFTKDPLFVALIFAATPAFFVYSPTMMMDIPILAFLMSGMALYFKATDGRTWLLLPAALCFILAAWTGYTALVPLVCLFIAQSAARRPVRELAAICAAPVALALWLAAMSAHFGEFPLARTAAYYAVNGSRIGNILAAASFLGGVTLFPWVTARSRRMVLAALLIACALTFSTTWLSLGGRAWYVLLASSGVMVLASFVAAARRRMAAGENHGEAVLILWVPAVLLFFIVIADMINARYILQAVPALYLVLFADASRRRLVFTLIPTAALSLALAYADFVFVNSNRDAVESVITPLQRNGYRVWSAAESGLRFYLEQNGSETLAKDDVSPAPGDLIVRSSGLLRFSLAEDLEVRLMVLRTITLNSWFPLRTFAPAARAGFHDSGLVPFTFSLEPYDRIEIVEFSPLGRAAAWSPKGPIFIQEEPERDFQLKIPANAKVEYELEGDGVAAVYGDRIRLSKGKSARSIWKNFRLLPREW